MEKKKRVGEREQTGAERWRQTGKGQMKLQMNKQIIMIEVKDISYIIADKNIKFRNYM